MVDLYGDRLDVLSSNFADDFSRLLDNSSKNKSGKIIAHSNDHKHRSFLESNQSRHSRSQNPHIEIDSSELVSQERPSHKRSSTTDKNINMDIRVAPDMRYRMNEIKEVDEGHLSQRRLRKRRIAIEQKQKQKQKALKLKKEQTMAAKRSRERLQQHLKGHGQRRQPTSEGYDEFEREVDYRTVDSFSDSRQRNTSILSFQNGTPMRPPQLGPSSAEQVMSSSFNPKRNQEIISQLNSGAPIRRFDTAYQKKTAGGILAQVPFSKIQSVVEVPGSSAKQQTPFWAASSKVDTTTDNSPIAVMQFEQIQEEDRTTNYQKTEGELLASQDLTELEERDIGQLDMFSVDQPAITAEMNAQIKNLKEIRYGRQLDHAEIVPAPFSPMSTVFNEFQNSQQQNQRRNMGNNFEQSDLKGRWLLSGGGSTSQKNLRSSSSEMKLECARERRLRQGFKRRIFWEKNTDLMGEGAEDSEQDRSMLESKLIKSLGPKLNGVVLQLPPTTVFDFKDQLRRPSSAKQAQSQQMHRSLMAFQKLKKQKRLEDEQERLMQIKKEQQIKDLYLDHYSWDMPYKMSTAGLNPSKDKSQGDKSNRSNDGKEGKKDKGKGKKQTTAKKIKSKTSKSTEEVPLNRQQQRQIMLENIEKERREKELSNLWPEPESKIFLNSRAKSAARPSSSGRPPMRRIKPPRTPQMMRKQINDQTLEDNKKFGESLRQKLEALGGQSPLSGPSQGIAMNNDLIIETLSSDQLSNKDGLKHTKSLGKPLARESRAAFKRTGNMRKVVRDANLNADLPMMHKQQTVTSHKKSKFFNRHQTPVNGVQRVPSMKTATAKSTTRSLANSMQINIQSVHSKLQFLRQASHKKTADAIAAIQKRKSNGNQDQQKPCRKHKAFNCVCHQVHDRKMSLFSKETALVPLSRRQTIYQKTVPVAPDFVRTWETKKEDVRKRDQLIYVREPPLPFWKDIKENYDDVLAEQIVNKKLVKLYDVQDIQRELEELTEDEEEISTANNDQKDVWRIKRLIKMSIKRYYEPPKTTLEMYKIGRVLGKGAYGKVNIALSRLTSRICAVKSINLAKVSSKEAMEKISSEKTILKDVRHSSIVKLYETVHDQHMGYELLFMELCTGGDLLYYLRRRRKLDENVAKLFMQQLFRGLGYLHHKGIVHRDIKLENVLLNNLGRIKLCDFGVSTCNRSATSGQTQLMKDCVGTPAYMAPEVIQVGEENKMLAKQLEEAKLQQSEVKKKDRVKISGYGAACDIWSAGVLLYALVYGNMPFRGVTVREIKEKVLKGKFLLKDSVSKEVRDLIRGMLVIEPEDRLSIKEILQHEWFSDTPKQDEVKVFNDSERAMMIKEFFFTEDPEKWDCFVQMQKDELYEYLGYTNSNLKTIDSTNQADFKNVSEGSIILAPNNSSQDEDRTLFMDLPPDIREELKHEQIGFSAQALRADVDYEREHNQHCDNGVYTENADIKELALRAGLKDKQQAEYSQMMMKVQQEQEAQDAKPVQRKITCYDQRGNVMPLDWEKIDENINWTLEPFKEPGNPFAEEIMIKCDLVFKVSRFGYKKEDIIKEIVNNRASHSYAAYQILTQDHESIC